MKRYLPWLLRVAVLLFAAVSLLSFISSLHWTGEVLANFRVQFLVAAFALWLVVVFLREEVSTVVLLACIAAHLIPLSPYLGFSASAPAKAATQNTASVRVLTINLDGEAGDLVKLRRLLRIESPDIIVLTELYGPRHRRFLAELNTDWPYRLGPLFQDPHEVTILSRIPYVHALVDHSASGNMVRVARFCPEQRSASPDCFTLVAAHPMRTVMRSAHQKWRDATLAVMARHAASEKDGRVVVAGDLNVTPWSPTFQSLLAKGNLTDGGLGLGITPTWLSSNPLFGLWIDHVLVGGCMTLKARHVGESVGSDHYPVIADLSVGRDCQDAQVAAE